MDTDFEKAPRNLERADQAIAMATMFLSEHIGVRAIVAMTESGGTARFLSRFRSSAPIYALSRHDGARRRMAMMRDVFPIDFDSRGLAPREAARDAHALLLDRDLLTPGDRVIFTSGDHMEHHGATNTLRLLQVGRAGKAERARRAVSACFPRIPLGAAVQGRACGAHRDRNRLQVPERGADGGAGYNWLLSRRLPRNSMSIEQLAETAQAMVAAGQGHHRDRRVHRHHRQALRTASASRTPRRTVAPTARCC